ncbi:MAG: right-handed parallel beta-helix repeat-containing protein [Clostridia bacterium]|nr:right-handed parallel beta-helix repeat-containing protein [Clostridia bacterium]
MKHNDMKKAVPAALAVIFALTVGNAFLFRRSFQKWIVPQYALSVAVFGVLAFALHFLYFKTKEKSKPLPRALACTAGYLAVIEGITVGINNLLLNGKHPHAAVAAVVFGTALYFALLALLTARAVKPARLPAALSAAVAVVLCFCVAVVPLIQSPVPLTKAQQNALHPTPTGFGVYTEKEKPLRDDADLYVATDGSDDNDGSFDRPLATMEKARELVRAMDKTDRAGITVAVRAGEYRVNALTFTEEDSGTESCPVTYAAYGDGETVLNGGVTLPPDVFAPVTDETARARLSEDARDKIVRADLSALGITKEDYGRLNAVGSYNTANKYTDGRTGPLACELFFNDKRYTTARYPNDGEWLTTEKVIRTGEGYESDGDATKNKNWDNVTDPAPDVYEVSRELADRIAGWKTLDDVWLFGYWKYDWADASAPVGGFDADTRQLTPAYVSVYGTKTGAPYYFYNVLEELDAPGEWYLDRENGLLYLYPPEELSAASIDLSLSTAPIISVENADRLTFDGFTVKGTRGDAIVMTGDRNTVTRCLIKNVAGNALSMTGYENLASENEITRTGKGGISLSGGDRETLTPGNNVADNNLIHDWSEVYLTYQPAVSLGGVGNVCSHNEIYNSPHEAVSYSGNNHRIEYNNIHDVCLLSDDAGAIYSGRRWDWYGNVIRYNAVYNLGADGHEPTGIYMDDALSGQTIYGNLVINAPDVGISLCGGRDHDVRNNVVIITDQEPFTYDQRARDGALHGTFSHSAKGGDLWQNLEESPWRSAVWQKAYPQTARFSDDFGRTDDPGFVPNPAYSSVTGNLTVCYAGNIGSISEAARKYSDFSSNACYRLKEMDKLFVDYRNGDYTLRDDAPVFDEIPDFEPIPIGEIGRY